MGVAARPSERSPVDDSDLERERVQAVHTPQVHPVVTGLAGAVVASGDGIDDTERRDAADPTEVMVQSSVTEAIDGQALHSLQIFDLVGSQVAGRHHGTLAHANGAVAAQARRDL